MILNREALYDHLLDNSNLSECQIRNETTFEGISYEYVVNGKLSTSNGIFSIVIGIPRQWRIRLVDVYIVEPELPFIPHLESNGKICLFDLEASVIDWDLFGILNQCIERAKDIIELGIQNANSNDFIDEFDSYIGNIKNKKMLKVVLPNEKKTQKIKFCPTSNPSKVQRKNEKHADYKKRTEVLTFFASTRASDFDKWGYGSVTQKNALYFYSSPDEAILPPNYSLPITKEYLNRIFKSGSIRDCKYNPNMNSSLIVFGINQPNGIVNVFAVILENCEFNIVNDEIELKSVKQIIPLICERLDTEYLLGRTSESKNVLSNKNFLLVGCGSIGSYVFQNLIKSGVNKITLVDHDKLKAENIYRHLLGIESIKHGYKAEALRIYGKNMLPDLNINTLDDRIEELVEDGSIELSEYDYIIAATGDAILNRWINYYIHENNIKTPVFYLWNEPLDIGSHVGFFDLNLESCYGCLFARDENGELFDKSAYTEKGQKIVKSNLGCQGSYIPYGSLISVQTSLLFINVLKEVATGRLMDNALYSQKGDKYYFEQAGLKVSDVYQSQNEIIKITYGGDLVNKCCDICGGK